MQITIKNPNELPTIDYRTVNALQGDLKEPRGHDKLFNVLKTRGFDIPLMLWFDPKKPAEAYLLDGHQRITVMTDNDMNDKGDYGVPYIRVEAKTKKLAMQRLLEITSQYGTITPEGLQHFLELAELPVAEALETVDLPGLDGMVDSDDLDDDFDLGDDDKSPYSQMTFSLAEQQKARVLAALELGKDINGETFGNENGNGNALYWIVDQWLAQRS